MTRDDIEALFAPVQDLATLQTAIASLGASSQPVRLLSFGAVQEDLDRSKRLRAEFGEHGGELVDAFIQKHKALAWRVEHMNVIHHPAVAVAMARVIQRRS